MVKIVLSFDDGRKDNYRVAEEILKQYNISATFNITAGYIFKSIEEKDKPGPHDAMDISEVKKIIECDLFEIAGHGYRHNNNIDNLIDGVRCLEEKFGCEKVYGIASPQSKFDLKNLEFAMKRFRENGINYIRISNNYDAMPKYKILLRRINRYVHCSYLYYYVNKESIMKKSDFVLYSIPVLKTNNLSEVVKFVDIIQKKEEYADSICIFMFHSILKTDEKYYDDLFSWDYEDFNSFCKLLNEYRRLGKVDICKTSSLYL